MYYAKMFFVISGFLITRLILEAVGNESFTFGGFYLRRARRLLPALLFTIFVSFTVGCFVFSPQHLERLGGSALHGILSISNFFFWSESGYFDAEARVKPLLHLWSLSVEEQFYFIWPLTLVLLQRASESRVTTPLIFILLGVASWAFAAGSPVASWNPDSVRRLPDFAARMASASASSAPGARSALPEAK